MSGMSGSVLAGAIDALVNADPSTLADGESIRELVRQHARLEAVLARAAARWDTNQEWAADGARTGSAWLAAKCGIAKPKAQRMLRLGRACRDLPKTEQAWLAGDVHAEHVSQLAAARTEGAAEVFDRDEQQLVDHATTMRFDHFVKALSYWRILNDADDADTRAERQVEDRCFDLSKTFQGTWVGDILLDPISGEIVDVSLRVIEHELWLEDWDEAKHQLGRDPLPFELKRTPKQRRADALVEMAIRARTAPHGGRRPEPLFTVLVGYERFQQLCELANGSVVAPSSLIPFLDQAWVERVVFDSPSRVIDVGVRRRFFTGGTRRAVQIRDMVDAHGECFDDFCDAPAWRLQVDHVEEWSKGGPTTQSNGRLACGYHNRLRNKRRPGAE
jgi:hypothetical protein